MPARYVLCISTWSRDLLVQWELSLQQQRRCRLFLPKKNKYRARMLSAPIQDTVCSHCPSRFGIHQRMPRSTTISLLWYERKKSSRKMIPHPNGFTSSPLASEIITPIRTAQALVTPCTLRTIPGIYYDCGTIGAVHTRCHYFTFANYTLV